MERRSIGFPLTLGIVLTLLALTLAVGWQVLVVGGALGTGLRTRDWALLVFGALFSLLLIVGLVWLCAWLVREMRVNQRQRAFLDAVTHEMKTPLTSLRLSLDTLVLHDPEKPQRTAFLGRMEEDLERLRWTVEQVLSAARSEGSGRRHHEPDVVELPKLLHSCIEEIRQRHTLPEDAVHLETESDRTVRGDPNELTVVFLNLLENAVKYSEDPVDVKVRVATNGEDRVDVAISDRGIGIPAGELRKIFQRFYRAGREVQRTASGLGLGLFIVRNLVRRQGGKVVAKSEGSGTGSRFVVTLRTAPPAA